MQHLRSNLLWLLLPCLLLPQQGPLSAEPIPVRHVEGVTLGFLVLRNLDGEPLAYGELKQVVNGEGVNGNDELVMDDLQFRFKDGLLLSGDHEIHPAS